MHPQHDAVVASVRATYYEPYPPMGWAAEPRRFGVYRRNTKAATYPNIVLTDAAPDDMPEIIRDAREYYEGETFPIRITIDDRALAAQLGPPLDAAGLELDERTVFLAHVGKLPEGRDAPGIRIEEVGRGGLWEYEDTRRKGFADSEEPSPPDDLELRVRLRIAEMEGGARYWLARADGQPAGCLSWYDGEDRLAFSLATRVQFRNRGIARLLLTNLLQDSEEAGTRAVIINADEEGTPVRLYRRLGFTDEVYWRVTYEFPRT
ncbi:MAG TPA: GNAT family N-acetyltransferase [Dehalococcoidia bacterium]|nr:GNAT family N-acetyltransferase [Dehalococcoidia bacterium]